MCLCVSKERMHAARASEEESSRVDWEGIRRCSHESLLKEARKGKCTVLLCNEVEKLCGLLLPYTLCRSLQKRFGPSNVLLSFV